MKGYIDLFVLPVPRKNIKAYCKLSTQMGKIMKKFGATEYREFLGDDLKAKGTASYLSNIKVKPGEVLVSAVVGFKSKTHRNQVNKRVRSDPKVLALIKKYYEHPLADHKKMLYGGFATIVKP